MKHAVVTCDCNQPERHGLPVVPTEEATLAKVFTILTESGLDKEDFEAIIRLIKRGLVRRAN
jgi:hypothetical protein